MNIALIAHDGKKAELVSFILQNKELVKDAVIYSTATTGSHMKSAGLEVIPVLSGPVGGDAQIAAMAAEGKLDLIIFFRDPLGKHAHEPDIQMLMRICDVHNVPLTTNSAGAELFLTGLKYKGHIDS